MFAFVVDLYNIGLNRHWYAVCSLFFFGFAGVEANGFLNVQTIKDTDLNKRETDVQNTFRNVEKMETECQCSVCTLRLSKATTLVFLNIEAEQFSVDI